MKNTATYTSGESRSNMQKIVFVPSHKSPWRRHPSDPRIVVDASDTIGSSLMRACIPYVYLKKYFSDKIDACYDRNLPDYAKSGDIVVFVKDYQHKDIEASKKRGCITVYDPVDLYHDTFQNNGKFDVMIASCNAHADIMAKKHNIERSKIIVIDVLHSNVNREKLPPRQMSQRAVVGAVSPGKTALLRPEVYEDFVNFGSLNNFDVRNVDFNDQSISLDYRNIRVNNLIECYRGIHIGLALYDPSDLDFDRLNQKPSTKISGYASYDIPVVCTYQRSMDKILERFPRFQDYIADNVSHSKLIVKKLVNDYDYYMESRKLFQDVGEMFHMDHAYHMYVDQINGAVIPKTPESLNET